MQFSGPAKEHQADRDVIEGRGEGGSRTPDRPPQGRRQLRAAGASVPRWYRFARLIGFLLLAAITVYGVQRFLTGDWRAVTDYWMGKLPLLLLILLLALLDMTLEAFAWQWVYERFSLRARDLRGFGVALSANAGLLLPAQLGRLIRPDDMVKLGRGSLGECAKAEATVFVFDALSVVSLLAGVVAWRLHPWLAPVASGVVITVSLFLGNQVAERLAGTKLGLPHDFWWSWQSVVIVLVQMTGWVANAVAFYVLVSHLPGNFTLWDALFIAPASSVIGLGTGVPGGIGTTEGLLGSALQFNQVPPEHFAMVVGAFRVVTFWIRLPIGWVALTLARRPPTSNGAVSGDTTDSDSQRSASA
jgi:uncharacterized membrane protein YbhN (UPF0104 family)